MSSRRHARSATIGLAVVGLTLASWLPASLPAQTAPQHAPPTVARTVRVDLSQPSGPSASSLEPSKRKAAGSSASGPVGTACAPINFTAMGLTWDQHGHGHVDAHIRVGPSNWDLGASTEVESTPAEGPDLQSPEHHAVRHSTELLWVGSGRCSRFAIDVPNGVDVKNVRAVFLNTSGTAASKPSSGTAHHPAFSPVTKVSPPAPARGLFAAAPAVAMATRPAITRRSQWGANESLRNCGPRYASAVKIAFVHHTAGSNSYTATQSDDIVRSIYWYHTQTNGWCDIGYNFLVDKYGQLFEGRYGGMTRPVIPAATMGFNTGSTSISAIGNFQNVSPPSAMVSAIERFLAWRLDVAHVSPTAGVYMTSSGSTGGKYPAGRRVWFHTISSHRDAGYTACPGNYLYAKVPTIRTVAYSLGLPKIFSPRQSRSGFTPVKESVTWTAKGSSTLTWRLQIVDAKAVVVRSFKLVGTTFTKTWTGTGTDGKPVPAGTYTATISATKDTKAARPASYRLVVRQP
ncbi:MAG TPA: peptidoglycan recognition protein [Actinomycetota bacterium]